MFVNVIIISSKFYSSSADRVSKMMSSSISMFFAFKCLMKKYPYYMLLYLILLTTVALGLMLQIVEGPVYKANKIIGKKDYNNYENLADCLWNVLIIITTVGYGDYFPKSNLGRFLVIFISFIGIILVSLIIMTLQNFVSFEDNENNAKTFVDRMNSKIEIKEEASNYFKTTLRFLLTKSHFIRSTKSKEDIEYKNLKGKLEDSMKSRMRQKVLLRGLIKNFNRDFEPFEPNEFLKEKVIDLENKSKVLIEDGQVIKSKLEKILKKLN